MNKEFVKNKVLEILSVKSQISKELITDDVKLDDVLGFDSLDMCEIEYEIESEFQHKVELSPDFNSNTYTVGKLMEIVFEQLNVKE